MKILFIDETGNYDQQQVVWRGGVVVDSDNYFTLKEKIEQVKFSFFGNSYLEFKWSDLSIVCHLIRSGKTLKQSFKWLEEFGPDHLQEYLEKVIEASCGNADCIMSTVSNFQSFQSESNLMMYQISDIMERFQFYLQEKDDTGLIVFDSINPQKDRELKKTYQFLLRHHNFIEKYSRVVDSLLSELSEHSAGIQSADYVVGALSGTLRGYAFSKQVFVDHIKGKLRSNKGVIIGYGLKVSPSSNTQLKSEVIQELGI